MTGKDEWVDIEGEQYELSGLRIPASKRARYRVVYTLSRETLQGKAATTLVLRKKNHESIAHPNDLGKRGGDRRRSGQRPRDRAGAKFALGWLRWWRKVLIVVVFVIDRRDLQKSLAIDNVVRASLMPSRLGLRPGRTPP